VQVDDPDMQRALDERAELIDQCEAELARRAIADQAPWTRGIATAPRSPLARDAWSHGLAAVAATANFTASAAASRSGRSMLSTIQRATSVLPERSLACCTLRT
jgi:hypothetical protein